MEEKDTCQIGDCPKTIRARKMCDTHYARWKRNPRILYAPVTLKAPEGGCVVSNCEGVRYSRGMCKRHYIVGNTYNLSPVQVQMLWILPCGICGEEGTPYIDHDHSCCPQGRSCGVCVRGVLCRDCNLALGGFKDSPQLLERAINYLTGKLE